MIEKTLERRVEELEQKINRVLQMNIIKFIGDVHVKYPQYKKIIKSCSNSIQVGDMGVGFLRPIGGELKPYANPPHKLMKDGNHRFIRGNHDNPAVCKRHSQYIPDGHFENGMMFIGGALSIDKAWRVEGESWWADEELSYSELNELIDKTVRLQPKIMVTHECPESIAGYVLPAYRQDFPSRTRQAFDSLFQLWKPKIWLFGHWHVSFNQEIQGTRFICLNELECVDIDIDACTIDS